MKHNKTIKDLTSCSVMILALALVNMLPSPISIAMGQTHTNDTSSLTLAPTTNSDNMTPTSATKPLRIAVPVRGFGDFTKFTSDDVTGEQKIGGFAVDVFDAVVKTALVKPFPFETVPFAKPDGTPKGTFDDMLKAVFSKEYDAAVGDIAIVDYRTDWVDFTLPYMATGISMLVPSRQQQSKNTVNIPLSRVTKSFVAATLAFSFIVALVFWVVEHRNDKYASQTPLANSHPPAALCRDEWRREILRSVIQTRLVMALFFMVLLVLIACYAASQTSSLSETRGRARMRNINQLIRRKAKVGYQQGSFIKNLLVGKGLLESQLVGFNTTQEMHDLLKGGVAAVIGLTPHLRLRQAGHCDTLELVPEFSLQAAGLGFAFPIESPKVRDMSNGILKLIYNGQMRRIQERTIGGLDTCQDDQDDGDLIDTDTLWILVAGAIGVLLLMIIMMMVQCGITCATNRKKKKALAYPCYVLPCC